jgi:hypothetical protein
MNKLAGKGCPHRAAITFEAGRQASLRLGPMACEAQAQAFLKREDRLGSATAITLILTAISYGRNSQMAAHEDSKASHAHSNSWQFMKGNQIRPFCA